MSDISGNICRASVANDKKIKKTCAPLKDGLGFDAFYYSSHDLDGNFYQVTNTPEIAEFCFSTGLYKSHPYIKNPKFFSSGFVLPNSIDDIAYQKITERVKNKFQVDQIHMIVHKSEEKLELYGFSTTQMNLNLSNSFVNNLFLFKKFISYFHEEAQSIIKSARDNQVNIVSECGDSYHSFDNNRDMYGSTINIEAFLSGMNKNQRMLALIKTLSNRERDCIKWLLKGRSASKIAKILHLSPRTVEFYLEQVKNKLGCSSKQELFDCLLYSKEFLELTFF